MKKKVIIIFTIVALAVSGAIYGFTYNSSNSDSENLMTAEVAEHSQSKIPLTVEESCMGGSNKTHGVIKNNSAVASYKDAVVRVTYVKDTYYSYIKPELAYKVYKEQTINEVFPPHSEVNVEFKIKDYKDLRPTGWELINATAN
ncbi:MAG: hypothetical protein ACXVPU_05580 [Bacteroidia bacterium]